MAAIRHVAGMLRMSPETLRLWQRRYEVDAGVKPGVTTEAAAEIKRLQRENVELRKANEIDMAAWAAGGRLDGLIHHADPGSNYLAVVYTDRIEELGAKPSTGTVGDSSDNTLAEAVNGLYKTELIRQRGPWRTVEQVELATLESAQPALARQGSR